VYRQLFVENLSSSYTERHLPYRITKCYLPPDTGKRTLP